MNKTCGTCPISLICHLGRLRNITLCPTCGIFQVKQTVNKCTTVYRINCPARRMEEKLREDYAKLIYMYDECNERSGKNINKNTIHNILDLDVPQKFIKHASKYLNTAITFKFNTLLATALPPIKFILDAGPPQEIFVRDGQHYVRVTFCERCLKTSNIRRINRYLDEKKVYTE